MSLYVFSSCYYFIVVAVVVKGAQRRGLQPSSAHLRGEKCQEARQERQAAARPRVARQKLGDEDIRERWSEWGKRNDSATPLLSSRVANSSWVGAALFYYNTYYNFFGIDTNTSSIELLITPKRVRYQVQY